VQRQVPSRRPFFFEVGKGKDIAILVLGEEGAVDAEGYVLLSDDRVLVDRGVEADGEA